MYGTESQEANNLNKNLKKTYRKHGAMMRS